MRRSGYEGAPDRLGEVLLGSLWWGATYAWGAALTAMLVLAPLLLANLLVQLVESVPATAALTSGVAAAYAVGLPPWDAEERPDIGLPLVIAGAAMSVVAWDLMRGTADAMTLLLALGVALAGWPLRRALRGRSA